MQKVQEVEEVKAQILKAEVRKIREHKRKREAYLTAHTKGKRMTAAKKDTYTARELDRLEKRFEEICNTPVMRIIHSMAQEQKKSGSRKWLQRFVVDEQPR